MMIHWVVEKAISHLGASSDHSPHTTGLFWILGEQPGGLLMPVEFHRALDITEDTG